MSAVVKVYTGLTLSEAEVHEILPQAEVASPIARGDLRNDLAAGVQIIVIIDGRFHHVNAVSPTEIMDTVRSGVRVYGASSMGALRAAELVRHGMIGHGVVFEHIRRAAFFRDDFVGQAYDPDSLAAVSSAFVDLFLALERLRGPHGLDDERFDAIIDCLKKLHYSERSEARVRGEMRARFPGDDELLATIKTMFSREESQKRKDGLSVLARVRDDIERIARRNASLDEELRELRGHACTI